MLANAAVNLGTNASPSQQQPVALPLQQQKDVSATLLPQHQTNLSVALPLPNEKPADNILAYGD